MANVYPFPYCLGTNTTFGDQNRVRREIAINGAPSLAVEIAPRVPIEISGQIVRANRSDWVIFRNRMAAGAGYAAVWDMERPRFGWDGKPALRTSDGAEFWHVNGRTSLYNDDAADGTTWRSIFAQAAGGETAGASTIDVDQLFPNEVLPRGIPARIGDYRYYLTEAATANSSGEATLALDTALRDDVADNQGVRIPGDLCVAQMIGKPETGPADQDGVGDFKVTFLEVYVGEVSGGFTWVVD